MLPVVVATTPDLGTINHTLLTIEAVREAGLWLRFVVMSRFPGLPSPMERSNWNTIAELGQVSMESLPELDLWQPDSLRLASARGLAA